MGIILFVMFILSIPSMAIFSNPGVFQKQEADKFTMEYVPHFIFVWFSFGNVAKALKVQSSTTVENNLFILELKCP